MNSSENVLIERNETTTNQRTLSGTEAVRLFWSVHNERRRSSSLVAETSSIAEDTAEKPQEKPNACRICRQSDEHLLHNICDCRGSIGFLHEMCLKKWIIIKRNSVCEVCQQPYKMEFKTGLTVPQVVMNFLRRRYITVVLRDALNFCVYFGFSVVQHSILVSLIEEKAQAWLSQECGTYFDPFVALFFLGNVGFNTYFYRWIRKRVYRLYGLLKTYWELATNYEYFGYFNPDYAVSDESQEEIETMLLSTYDDPADDFFLYLD